MEEEASRLLGQKVIKAYEEIVILKDKLKDKEKEIKRLEKELAAVRKLMEKEVASYQRKLKVLYKKSGFKEYIKTLEKEKRAFKEKLALKEKEIEKASAAIQLLNEEVASRAKRPKGIPSAAEEQSISTGKVVSVSKKYNFVIIEFKDTSAIDIGRIFLVFRDEKKIGEVKVAKIKKRYVFSDIVNTITDEEIKEGDTVK